MIVEAAVIEWKVGAFVPVTVKVEAASSTVESTEAETEEAKAESEKREEAETEAESTGAASGSSIDFFFLTNTAAGGARERAEWLHWERVSGYVMFSEEVGEVVS